MRAMFRRPLVCVLGAVFVLLCGVGFSYRASLAQNPPDRFFEEEFGRAKFEFDSVRVENGVVQFNGWFVIGASQSWEETYAINARFMDDEDVVHAELNLGTVVVPAGAENVTFEFHGEQPIPPGRYGIVMTAYEDGVMRVAPDGTTSPSSSCSDSYLITVR